MAKVTIEVVGAVVDGHGPGEKVSVDEKSAAYLERIGYAKVVKEEPKKAPQPKKPTKEAK